MSLATQNHTGARILTGLTALSGGQSGAYPLVPGAAHEFTTVASSTGAILPAPPHGPPVSVIVTNAGANTLSIYPPSGGTVAGGSTNAAYSLSANNTAVFYASSLTNYYLAGSTTGGSSGVTGLTGDVTTPASSSGSTAAMLYGQTSVATATISSSQNNYSPTGYLSAGAPIANVIAVTQNGGGDIQITGLVPPTSSPGGFMVTIRNVAASVNVLHLVANSGSSSAANQFGFLWDVWLAPGEDVLLIYDATSSLWREAAPHKDAQNHLWGSGFDGAGAISSGTTTQARATYYTNLTLSGTGVLQPQETLIYVNGILDLSGAQTGAITCNGNNGGNGVTGSGTGGSAGAALTVSAIVVDVPLQGGGAAGGGGATGSGTAGTAATGKTLANLTSSTGANGGSGGGVSGNGGATVTGPTNTQGVVPYAYTSARMTFNANGAIDINSAGVGGSGGSGGGGDGARVGGSGGGGGCSGGAVIIFARSIWMGSANTTGVIQAKGGTGGTGGNGGTTGGTNAGGGGGGGGGSGGTIVIIHGGRYGTGGALALDASSGAGGGGGTGVGTGTNGNGGQGGMGGLIVVHDVRVPLTSSTVFVGTAKTANSTSTGGTSVTTQLAL